MHATLRYVTHHQQNTKNPTDGNTGRRRPGLGPRGRYLAYRLRGQARDGLFPEWVKTTLMAVIWFIFLPISALIVAPFHLFSASLVYSFSLLSFTLLAIHLWPPKTPKWRTMFWAFVASTLVGLLLQNLMLPQWTLFCASLTGYAVVILRVNQNGRKLWKRWLIWRDPIGSTK